MKEGIKVRGNVHLILTDENGNVKVDRLEKNLVVATGLAYIADAISKTPGSTVMTHMAVGSGSTAASASDTTLVAELTRVALTGSTPTDAGAVVTYTCTFSAGAGTGTLYEAGIFNAASSGTMLSRLVYGVITKAAGDTLAVTWTLTFADDGV